MLDLSALRIRGGVQYNGTPVPAKPCCGVRGHYEFDGYHLKVERASGGYGNGRSQCGNEVRLISQLEDCDKQYFMTLIACYVEPDADLHWTLWPHYEFTGELHTPEDCKIVDMLAEKYKITDCASRPGDNWQMYKGKPLLVDFGFTY